MALNDKDLNLKLCVSAIFRGLGYTVFQEVDLCTYSYQPKYSRKQITDFDVLGVSIEPDFALHVAVAECKSVEEKAMEHLLKLNGVKEFFHADKAYFVQKKIDINAREIGRDLGIWVLDENNINTLMAGVGVSDKPHVEIEREVYSAKLKAFAGKKSDLAKLSEYLRYDFWTLPDHRNIINLIRLLKQASSEFKPENKAHVSLAHQVATNLSLAIIRLTSEIVKHNINDLPDGTLTRMLGGPRDRRDREALFDTIAKLVPDSRLSAVPPFQDALEEVVARLVNASISAAKIVPCLDHITRYTLIPEVYDVFGEAEALYGSRSLKLARDVIHFIIEQTGVSNELFNVSLTEENIEKNAIQQ